MAQIYKKINHQDKRNKRSVNVTSEEAISINEINQRFLELFKLKHLS